MVTFVNEIQLPKPCVVSAGFDGVRGKMRSKFHLPSGGRSSTTTGRVIVTSLSATRFPISAAIE